MAGREKKAAGEGTPSGGGDGDEVLVPEANVVRMMKKVLPGEAKIDRDAKDLMRMCVSEFIHLITSEASGKCMDDGRKRISGNDILYSLRAAGMDNYKAVCEAYLAKWREAKAAEAAAGRGQEMPCNENAEAVDAVGDLNYEAVIRWLLQ